MLLNRDTELRALDDAIGRTRAGAGQLILVAAGAGLGKTALLAEAARRAQQNGLAVLTARGGELEHDIPYGLARQLFETPLRALGTDARERLMAGAAACCGALIGFRNARDGAVDQPGAIHALYWLLANLAELRPVLLAIDDVHWADAETARWLNYVAGRIAGLPILAVVAGRPAQRGDEPVLSALHGDQQARTLALEPLDVDAIARLVCGRLGSTGDAAFVEACHRATGGNPFLATELLRAAALDGLQPTAADAVHVSQLGSRDVAESTARRLARLGVCARRLAEAVSVLGTQSELRHAATLGGLSVEAALAAWDELVAAEILGAAQPLEFIHPLTRTAVYGSLAAGARSRAHRHAAGILARDHAESLRIARHAAACEPSGDRQIVRWLRTAARAALASGAPDAAARHLHRALREPPSPADRPLVEFELGQALISVDSTAAAEHFARSATATTDAELRLRARRWRGFTLAYSGQVSEAVDGFNAALELTSDPETSLYMAATRDFFAAWLGDLRNGTKFRHELLQRAQGVRGDTPGERRALAVAALSICHAATAPAHHALDLAARASPSGLMTPDADDEDETAAAVGVVRIICDDPRPSIFGRSLTASESHGSVLFEARMLRSRAIIAFRRGELMAAEVDARASWQILESRRDASPVLYWWAVAVLVEVLIARGLIDEAARMAESTALGAEPLEPVMFPWPPVLRGRLALAEGNLDSGVALLLDAGAWLERRGFANPAFIPWRALAAPALAALGRAKEAQAVIGPAVERARSFGAPWGLGTTLRAAGIVVPGTAGIDLLEEAAHVLADSPCRLEYAAARLSLGATVRRTGQRTRARGHLRAALDLAHQCGAMGIASDAEAELRAAGARPRRPRISGLESLTASERRIAEMAGAGKSNREIAQSLFVSRKTVETHLGHVYVKLDIRSRHQLGAALTTQHSQPDGAVVRES